MGNTRPPGRAKLAKAPPPGLTVARGGGGWVRLELTDALQAQSRRWLRNFQREIKLMVTTLLELKSCAHCICISKQTIFTNLVISKVLKSHTRIPTSEAQAIERPLN